MPEFIKLSDAAFVALCKINPLGMMALHPAEFREWIEKQDASEKLLIFAMLGKAWIEQERKNG